MVAFLPYVNNIYTLFVRNYHNHILIISISLNMTISKFNPQNLSGVLLYKVKRWKVR